MTPIRAAALPALCFALSAPALAQDEGTPPLGDPVVPAETPRGILGPDYPENEERQTALLLQNFLQMDLNGDFLVAESEWEAWRGWRGSPAPDFAMVDANGTAYIAYREYEETALSMGDSRLADGIHGAVFPDEAGVAE